MYSVFITACLKLSDELGGQLVLNTVTGVKKEEALHPSNSLSVVLSLIMNPTTVEVQWRCVFLSGTEVLEIWTVWSFTK